MSETTAEPTQYTSVRSVGVFADRNAKHRRFMEDAHTITDKLNNDDKQGFFAVFDGHGGKTAALYCQQHFHNVIQEELANATDLDNDENVFKVIRSSYQKTDEAMKPSVPSAGACVVTALVRVKSNNQRVLYCANAGDSRGVLNRGGKAVNLSFDHKASNLEECQRVEAAGGFIKNERVNGMIAITRALGDHCMKSYIISEPHIEAVELNDDDTLLILACDGVWDVLSCQDAVDLVKDETDPTQMAKKILVHAIKGGSTDNITVMVVIL
eukprot:TRINITY_DN10268_c0_g1_i1.p1 TRINITY_DN10268_c0_g1~~TRINITY_DN10268_c0_g1_i1.p1  ORF type:complete len:269 (-),score=38.50 TRINITY_DN10268_c0_g1_i1:58-864(-)